MCQTLEVAPSTYYAAGSTLAAGTVLIAGAGRMGSSLAHAARLAGADVTIASRLASDQ
jgi:threonine dehydrogenase-like Zn-dependent dehydrogenase